jgi:hypothetical protein
MLMSICKKTILGAQYADKHVRITANVLILKIKLPRSCSAIEQLKPRTVKCSGGRAAAYSLHCIRACERLDWD